MQDSGSEGHVRAALWAERWRLSSLIGLNPSSWGGSMKLKGNAATQRMVALGEK
jgi:hypothetical protein